MGLYHSNDVWCTFPVQEVMPTVMRRLWIYRTKERKAVHRHGYQHELSSSGRSALGE